MIGIDGQPPQGYPTDRTTLHDYTHGCDLVTIGDFEDVFIFEDNAAVFRSLIPRIHTHLDVPQDAVTSGAPPEPFVSMFDTLLEWHHKHFKDTHYAALDCFKQTIEAYWRDTDPRNN